MKRFIITFLFILLISAPLNVLAWPRTLHDDGGPYLDFALVPVSDYLAAAVLTPWSVELTILDSAGSRLAWTTFALPDNLQILPEKNISLHAYPDHGRNYAMQIPIIGSENNSVSLAGFFSALLVQQNNAVSLIPQATINLLPVPDNAQKMEVAISAADIYLIWRIQTEDDISSVLVNQLDRESLSNKLNP